MDAYLGNKRSREEDRRNNQREDREEFVGQERPGGKVREMMEPETLGPSSPWQKAW